MLDDYRFISHEVACRGIPANWNLKQKKKFRYKASALHRNFSLSVTHHMLQTHLQDGLHMVIGQRVPEVLAVPAEFDQVHLL